MKTIRAVYEAGVLRPIKKLRLPEHQPVLIALLPTDDDPPTFLITDAAVQGKSFDFLANPVEDLYHLTDGEAV